MSRLAAVQPPDAAVSLLPLLYALEQADGWSSGMRGVTHALLDRCTLPPGPWVDLGCGGGAQVTALHSLYGESVWGVDLHPAAFGRVVDSMGLHRLIRADLRSLPWPAASVGLVLALDTFDQADVQISLALAESRRILRSDGLLVLRVSAHPWLLGPHDAAFHTGRRYTRRGLMEAAMAAGFTVVECTFANTLAGLPAAWLRLLQRHRLAAFSPALYTHRGVNRLLRATLSIEARWLRRRNLPIGLSLYLVARRQRGDGPIVSRAADNPAKERSDG